MSCVTDEPEVNNESQPDRSHSFRWVCRARVPVPTVILWFYNIMIVYSTRNKSKYSNAEVANINKEASPKL